MNILTKNYKLYNGDCLEVMDRLIDEGVKVDCILTDMPYGTMRCKWDNIIPFDKMWDRVRKLTHKKSSILLFGQNPFSAKLICSNIEEYNHGWTWEKSKCANFQLAKHQPRRMTEDILVFTRGGFSYQSKNKCTYNPIMIDRKPIKPTKEVKRSSNMFELNTSINKKQKSQNFKSDLENFIPDKSYPKNIIYFSNNSEKRVHPTQKPVDLLEYLIKTYTNEDEIVLDFTMGSGSTGVACLNCNRRFIGIELEEKYFNISINRIFENYNN